MASEGGGLLCFGVDRVLDSPVSSCISSAFPHSLRSFCPSISVGSLAWLVFSWVWQSPSCVPDLAQEV